MNRPLPPFRLPSSSSSPSAVAKPAIEPLESRVHLHGAEPDVVYPHGTLVPWLTAPITLAPPDTGQEPPVSPPPVPPPPPPPPPPPVVDPPPVDPAPTTPAFTNITWTNKANSPIVRAEALTAKWNDRLYVFGGFSGALGPVTTSHYYTPATNTWTAIADLPERLTHVGMAQTDSAAYFVGGYVGLAGKTGYGQTYGSNRVWKYDFAADTYSPMPNLPRPLAGGGSAIVGSTLHYFGGYELNRADTAVHLMLDLNNPSAGWKSAAALPNARNHMGSVAFGGKIYAIAGQTGTDEGLVTKSFVEVYDPATDTWASRKPIPASVSHIASATFVMGDRIIVMGGEKAHNQQVRECWAYTPATDTWVQLTSLPAPRFSGVANVIGGKIVFTTGGSAATTWLGTPTN
jgi:N-acetylneuraminic acid mutarotase